LATVGGNFHG